MGLKSLAKGIIILFFVLLILLIINMATTAYFKIGFEPTLIKPIFFAPVANEAINKEMDEFTQKCNLPIDKNIAYSSSGDYNKAYKLCNWVRSRFAGSGNIPKFDVDFGRLIGLSNSWFFFTGRGKCAEASELYNSMAESVGLKAREIYNEGENHQFSEVLVDGRWVHVDPSGIGQFDNPKFYESESFKWEGKRRNYSYLYFNENGKKQSVTSSYTETAKLTVKVTKNGIPLQNGYVKIKSHTYASRNVAVDGTTNENGIYEIELGDNNYTVIAYEFSLPLGLQDENDFELLPNEDKNISLELENGNYNDTIQLAKGMVTRILVIILGMITMILVIILVIIVRRWERKGKLMSI